MTLSGKYKILAIIGILILSVLGIYYRNPIWEKLSSYSILLTDREQVKAFITSFGAGAPAVFILFQIAQVLLAPVPGEATGFIGGYVFGAAQGFLYSSIGLTVGSWINFSIGRFLGERYVKKLVPAEKLNRLDKALKRQGILVVFILFIIPGFPKDYLCLFLGFGSTLPLKILIILAGVGRMPGTFMLSLQGAFLFNRSYERFALVTAVCLLIFFLAYRYRQNIYHWIEQANSKEK